ncbi:MAG: phosphomannomutase/phosphoglucomutase [Planctomycetes bacterium]|nr:phosphomannomutase/phosphoglucomutase [Planctomycetota bacterium]
MSIFKAYDVRGVYGPEINEEIARKIGNAFARLIEEGTVVVGYDMRESSAPLKLAFVEGVLDFGLSVIDIGMVSTPTLYFATGHLKAAGGVVITASHNPAKYNGMKFCREEAIPISYDTGIDVLEREALQGLYDKNPKRGTITTRNVFADYKKHVLSFLEPGRKLKVVVDAGNGMGGLYGPILAELGCEVNAAFMEPDGNFPNHEANPLKPENLRDVQRLVRETRADFGIGFDGDADRCIAVDDKAEIVGCDFLTALLAPHFLEKHPGTAVVYDLRSSWVVAEEVKKHGGRPCKWRVGHSFLKAKMRELGAYFGGELSGHFYYQDNYFADSGIITLIQVINHLRRNEATLSEQLRPLKRYHTSGEINFEIEDKDAVIDRLREAFSDGQLEDIDGVSATYEDWWFNVRKSNTEPILRLTMEAKSKARYDEAMARLLSFLGTPVH